MEGLESDRPGGVCQRLRPLDIAARFRHEDACLVLVQKAAPFGGSTRQYASQQSLRLFVALLHCTREKLDKIILLNQGNTTHLSRWLGPQYVINRKSNTWRSTLLSLFSRPNLAERLASLQHMNPARADAIIRFRHAHDARKDAKIVFKAACEGRPMELEKRLRLGKLAGGLAVRCELPAVHFFKKIESEWRAVRSRVLQHMSDTTGGSAEVKLPLDPAEATIVCSPLTATVLADHEECVAQLEMETSGSVYSMMHGEIPSSEYEVTLQWMQGRVEVPAHVMLGTG